MQVGVLSTEEEGLQNTVINEIGADIVPGEDQKPGQKGLYNLNAC